MDVHDERLPSRKKGLLGWLGLTAPDDHPAPDDRPAPVDPHAPTLTALGEFLARHDLPLTRLTLAAAFDCVTGADPRLAATVAERCQAALPITPAWLEEIHHTPTLDDEARLMSQLMARLETNIAAFSRTTDEARTATSEYHTTLKAQVAELHEVSRVGSAMTEMLAIARTMIDCTREVESQLARSEKETRALHASLDEARRTAETDHLTGLPNRRAFEASLEREVREAQRAGEPICLAFCDIDRFKKINDTHGHEAGDRVLRAVAHALDEISSDRCQVARHGGEEFVALIRGKTLAEAYALLDHTREGLAERRMVNRATDVPFGKVTFSAGIAALSDYPDARATLKAADEALYVAKKEGRNRIVRAPAEVHALRPPKAA